MTMMRRAAQMIGKLGEQNFASVFSDLGSFGAGGGLDTRWRGTVQGLFRPLKRAVTERVYLCCIQVKDQSS